MEYPINNRAIYIAWILVTLWTLQILSEILVIAASGFVISRLTYLVSYQQSSCTSSYSSDSPDYSCYSYSLDVIYVGLALGSAAIALIFGIIFFITHVVQITRYGCRRLTPKANFIYDCVRFVLSTIILTLNIVLLVLYSEYVIMLAAVILNWILCLFSIIYASILLHRYRRGAYNNLLPTTYVSQNYQSQVVPQSQIAPQSQWAYPEKQGPTTTIGPFELQHQVAPAVVPTPPGYQP